MLPNRIVLIVVLLVYHTRTTSPLWRPYYDKYHLTITDRVRYYRLAYVIRKCAISVKLISFCVYHTNVPGYHHRLCNPVTPFSTKQSIRRIDILHLSHWDSSEKTDNLTVMFMTPCASMAKSPHSSESLEDIIREENIGDYDSDTVVEEGETPETTTSASCEPSHIAPSPFTERSTAQALTALRASTTLDEPIITNKARWATATLYRAKWES